LLQWVIDDLLVRKPSAQILFASPMVRNLDVFGRLFGLDNLQPIKSAEPTVSQNFIFADVLTAKKGVVQFSRAQMGDPDLQVLGQKQLDQTLASRKDRIIHIALSMEGTGASLVYANGAAEAETFALQLADHFAEREKTTAREALAELAREVVHEKFVLADCLSKGVGFHYSNIPTVLRRLCT
jgi:replicative superfamily II helicase